MLGDWDRAEKSGFEPCPSLNASSSKCSIRGLAAPVPPHVQRAASPPLESSAGKAGPSVSAYSPGGGRGGAVDRYSADAGAWLSGGGGRSGGGAARGSRSAPNSGLAAASRSPAAGGGGSRSNKNNGENSSSGRSSSGVGSSTGSRSHGKCRSDGAAADATAAGGGDRMASLSRSLPQGNSSCVGGSPNNNSLYGVSSLDLGTHCFPPPLPRPTLGVVQEARAFAPGQHLAVLQALLNGEEGQGDQGFHSDSDSEREEETGSGGRALVGEREEGVVGSSM